MISVVFGAPGFGGLASTSEMHTIVLPIPISSHRKPPRIRRPSRLPSSSASVDFSMSSMNARLCFWYGRSFTLDSSPAGSGVSTG